MLILPPPHGAIWSETVNDPLTPGRLTTTDPDDGHDVSVPIGTSVQDARNEAVPPPPASSTVRTCLSTAAGPLPSITSVGIDAPDAVCSLSEGNPDSEHAVNDEFLTTNTATIVPAATAVPPVLTLSTCVAHGTIASLTGTVVVEPAAPDDPVSDEGPDPDPDVVAGDGSVVGRCDTVGDEAAHAPASTATLASSGTSIH